MGKYKDAYSVIADKRIKLKRPTIEVMEEFEAMRNDPDVKLQDLINFVTEDDISDINLKTVDIREIYDVQSDFLAQWSESAAEQFRLSIGYSPKKASGSRAGGRKITSKK